MNIRNATYRDAPAIRLLLDGLGYKTTISLLIGQLEKLSGSKDHHVFVFEQNKEILGFIAVHFLPQLGFDGDLAIISYLAIDTEMQRKGIGKQLETYVSQMAWQRKCDRIQLHCADWRTPAHQFYIKQGYQEYPKYFTKRLVYAE